MNGFALRQHERPASGSLVIVVAAALLMLASVVATASPGGFRGTWIAIPFAAFIALGEVVRITLPGRRDAAPIATAGGLAYALLTTYAEEPTEHGAFQVVLIATVAMLLGIAPHIAAGRTPSVPTLARRLLVIGFAAFLFRGLHVDDAVRDLGEAPLALVMMVVIMAASAVDALLAAVIRAGEDGAPYRAVLRNELQASAGLDAAIGATGALIALAATVMGAWALPIFVVPLLLTQFAFRRYAAVRESSLQTIRALSRVTEVGGYTESGHAQRVSALALAVGRELGMSDPDLRDLEYAALMHDIGQLSLSEPIPGGATLVAAPPEQRRIADLGADVIAQTGVLDTVAHIVRQQAEPYRRAHTRGREEVPLASRIIKAVNAYDDLVGERTEPSAKLEALERLRLGMAYEYDPVVVESLTNTVERSVRLGG